MTEIQCIKRSDTVADVLQKFDRSRGNSLVLVDTKGVCSGVVSLDDIREFQDDGAKGSDDLSKFDSIATVRIREHASYEEIESVFQQTTVDQIPVIDSDGKPVKLLDRQDYRRILLSTPHMGGKEFAHVASAFDTNWIAPAGPHLEAFETEISGYVGGDYTVALSSGTAAIHLALIALGVKRHDTVLCSTLTFVASANPIRYLDAEPVFVDSEPASWNMCPDTLERAIEDCAAKGKKPKAVIVVSLYGQSADMDPICKICRSHDIPIIEDSAEALGAQYKDRQSGTFGTVGVYSFNGNKIITTSGGGALVTNDKRLSDKVRSLATQARKNVIHYEHEQVGFNYRMSNVLAGIGRGQLCVLEDRVKRRREIFNLYQSNLDKTPGISFMPEPEGFHSTRWLTVMLVSEKANGTSQELISYLDKNGIEARPVWKPMHTQPIFLDYAYFSHTPEYSVSDALFREGICLPSGSNNSDRDIMRVIKLVEKFFQSD